MSEELYPGWKLTKPQHNRYWREVGRWSKHHKAVTAEQREDARKNLHLQTFGDERSAKDVDNDGLTELIGVVAKICEPDNMNAQLRQIEMPKTKLIHRIKGMAEPGMIQHLLSQRFTFAVWLRRTHPQMEGMTISQKSKHPAPPEVIQEYRDSNASAPLLEDLNEKELQQMRNTLAR